MCGAKQGGDCFGNVRLDDVCRGEWRMENGEWNVEGVIGNYRCLQ